MIEKNDWRSQGQEKYLKNKTLYHKKYIKYSEDWKHEHCDFCNDEISEYNGDLHDGYCTKNEEYWICKNVIMILKKCLTGK